MRKSELRTMPRIEILAGILLPEGKGPEGNGQILRIKPTQQEIGTDRKIQSLATLSDLLDYTSW